jgi:hypothetical protein
VRVLPEQSALREQLPLQSQLCVPTSLLLLP